MHIIERFTRGDADVLNYQATITDPGAFTRPGTMAVPLVRDDHELFEYACHEGNYGLKNILSAAFIKSKAAAQGKK